MSLCRVLEVPGCKTTRIGRKEEAAVTTDSGTRLRC